MILRRADDSVICECEPGTRLTSTYQGLVIAEPSGRVRIVNRDGSIDTLQPEPPRDA